MENKVISIVSGGFDPVHPGHIMMMNDCLDFSDYLVVGINSNQWLINKKGNFFMDIKHRIYVINSLAAVDEAIVERCHRCIKKVASQTSLTSIKMVIPRSS